MDGGDVLCKPANWSDVILFLLLNYGTHLATLRTDPAKGWVTTTFWYLWVLATPFLGIAINTDYLFRLPNFAKTDLETVALSKALVVVVRKSDWAPDDKVEEDITGVTMERQGPGHIVRVGDINDMLSILPGPDINSIHPSISISTSKGLRRRLSYAFLPSKPTQLFTFLLKVSSKNL